MEISELFGIVIVLVLGISSCWIAWRLRLPSILLLIIIGFLAGPVSGLLKPDEIMGQLMLPFVSLSVAVILFEGGLNLRFNELRQTARVVRNLVTIGLVITWMIATFTAYWLFDFSLGIALLLGALLVVTGPTVTLPLLHLLRPNQQISSIIKWEGIVIDPLGAILAVLVFEAITAATLSTAVAEVIMAVMREVLVAGGMAFVGAIVLIQSMKRYWVPEHLHNAFVLMLLLAVYALCEFIQESSGLLAAMIMGIILANQKTVNIRHIAEFKENLRVLIISSLFILLSARLDMGEIADTAVLSLILLAVLVLVARPLAVLASTFRSKLKRNERAFLAGLAPRGIIAASVASIFALRLADSGFTDAEKLVSVTFVIIAGSVLFYGVGSPFLARRLKVAVSDPQGVIIVGGRDWMAEIAATIHKEGFHVIVVDANWANISAARMKGLQVFYADMLSEQTQDELDWTGVGYLMAATSDDDYNSLVSAQFGNIPGRQNTFQLAPVESRMEKRTTLRGRTAFGAKYSYEFFDKAYRQGATLKVTRLSSEYDYVAYKNDNLESFVPLFVIDEKNKLSFFNPDREIVPQPGQKIISMFLAGNIATS